MFTSSYVFQPRPSALKGRSQRSKGYKAVSLFGKPGFIFIYSTSGDPYHWEPLVVELETNRPEISGYAFIGEWIAKEHEKWLKDDSRLALGTATGVPWK